MLHNSLHRNKNLCGQDSQFLDHRKFSDKPSQAMMAGPLALEYFFLCWNALSPVLLFSLSGKLHSLEEPSSYMVSSIKAFSSPVGRDRHSLYVLPWSLCSVAFEVKIYFLLFSLCLTMVQCLYSGYLMVFLLGTCLFLSQPTWFG